MPNQQRPGHRPGTVSQHRREFLRQSGILVLAASGLPLVSGGLIATTDKQTPETLVKVLYDSLTETQRAKVCFDWNHMDKNRGLLRTRLENNWKITEPSIKSSFYTSDQQHLQSVLQLLLEPFRKSDQEEVTRCLKVQGGLDACRLAFYREGDLGSDGLWDNWRLEGPSFVWYFRGKPHVHVWVNVADTPDIELNSYQDSVGV